MFKKKNIQEVWSGEDLRMKELIDQLSMHSETMVNLCERIIVLEGSANMLPDGPDKRVELAEIETYRKRMLCIIGAYDDDLRQYKEIDHLKLRHYNGKAEWCSSHKMLHIAWQRAYKKVIG